MTSNARSNTALPNSYNNTCMESLANTSKSQPRPHSLNKAESRTRYFMPFFNYEGEGEYIKLIENQKYKILKQNSQGIYADDGNGVVGLVREDFVEFL